MTSTRELIHFLISHFAVLKPCVDKFNALLVVFDRNNNQIFNEGLSLFNRLPDLQLSVARVK